MGVLISANIFSFFKVKQDIKDIFVKKLECVGRLDFYNFLLVFYNGFACYYFDDSVFYRIVFKQCCIAIICIFI